MNTLVALLVVVGALVLWRRRAGRDRPDPRRELAGAAMHLGRAVREGASLPEALARTASHTRGPVADGLRRTAQAIERGVAVDEALTSWAGADPGLRRGRHRAGPTNEEVQLLVAAARFGQAHGGDLATAFEGVSMALLDRAEVSDESAALCSQARASTVVLCGLPVAGVAIFSMVDPRVPALLLGTPTGWLCLAAAGALDLTALWVSDRLVAGALT